MRNGWITIVAGAVGFSMVVLGGCSITPPRPDEDNDDGLVRVETAMLDDLFVAPNVSLANYRRVMLDPIEVTFKKPPATLITPSSSG